MPVQQDIGGSDAIAVELSADLVARAEAMGIDVAKACEQGLSRTIARSMGDRWLAENGAALATSNAHVDRLGLPLASHRLF